MNQRIKDLIDQNLDPEALIKLVAQDCANIAYETAEDMEEAEHLAKTICDCYDV